MSIYVFAFAMMLFFMFMITEWDVRPDYVGSVKTFLGRLTRSIFSGILGFFTGLFVGLLIETILIALFSYIN